MQKRSIAAALGVAFLLASAGIALADSETVPGYSGIQLADAETVAAHHGAPYGPYLTADEGRAVYMFTADHDGMSACSGACAKAWPPVMTDGTPLAGQGVEATLLGAIRRAGGMQVTYAGKPLYYFVGDKQPGTTAGEGITHFGGSWYLLSPGGQAIEKTAAAKGGGSW